MTVYTFYVKIEIKNCSLVFIKILENTCLLINLQRLENYLRVRRDVTWQ